MSEAGVNYSIRDEIREFWSARAATFDQSVGHEIFSDAERAGWHRLLRKHLGEGARREALDLASGTGVISHLLHDLGFAVTGADWSEAMLEQARAKARLRNADIRFIMRDAENTMEPRGSYDVITNRHLVWTLVDPVAAFAEWFALLKPGGKLLIVDGNMGHVSWVTRMVRGAADGTGGAARPSRSADGRAAEADPRTGAFFNADAGRGGGRAVAGGGLCGAGGRPQAGRHPLGAGAQDAAVAGAGAADAGSFRDLRQQAPLTRKRAMFRWRNIARDILLRLRCVRTRRPETSSRD